MTGKGDFLISNIPRAICHCVVGNVLPTSYGLSGSAVMSELFDNRIQIPVFLLQMDTNQIAT